MEFLYNIPQPLYKYRVWEEACKEIQLSRRILTDNEIYLATANQFNDPFDGSLPFRYKKEDLTPENIFKKLYDMIKESEPHLVDEEIHKLCFERQYSGVFESGEYWKSLYPGFKKEVNETFGITALTSKRDNLLMWSHYADSHKGFCVGLDKEILFKECAGQLGPVIYSNKFPELRLFEKSPLALSLLTTTKSKHWEYEDEYRIVKIHGAREVIKLPNKAILEIIFGSCMLEEHKQVIFSLAKDKFPSAKVFETQINLDEFKLDFIPILN